MKVERFELVHVVEYVKSQMTEADIGDYVYASDYAALHKLAVEMSNKLAYTLSGMSATCQHEGCNCGSYWNHDSPEDIDEIAEMIAHATELL